MSLSSVAVVLLLCGAQLGGAHQQHQNYFYGTVMSSIDIKGTHGNQTTVVMRYKNAFTSCRDSGTWECVPHWDCKPTDLKVSVGANTAEWCQQVGIMTLRLAPNITQFTLQLRGAGTWIHNNNSIVNVSAVTDVFLSNSDTENSFNSPKTTIIPLLRVRSNCVRNYHLLAFDPGNGVECRSTGLPSFLHLPSHPFQNCILSFSGTNSSNEGTYVVQLTMTNLLQTSTDAGGSQYNLTSDNVMSLIPLQFVVKVDGTVPSCTEGVYIPRFLPPTPANGEQLYTRVGHELEITINTEANGISGGSLQWWSTAYELLFSGPHNMWNTRPSFPGPFILKWTPSQSEVGDHPVCFVAQASMRGSSAAPYQSDLRCVIVSVFKAPRPTPPPPPPTPCESLFCGGPKTIPFSYFTYVLTLALILYSVAGFA